MTESKKDYSLNTDTNSVAETASTYSTTSAAGRARNYLLKLKKRMTDKDTLTEASKRTSSYQSAAQYLSLK